MNFNDPQYSSIKVFLLLALIISSGYFVVTQSGPRGENLLGRIFNGITKSNQIVPKPSIQNVINTNLVTTPSNCTNVTTGTLRYCNEIFSQEEIVTTSGTVFSSTYGLKFDLYTPPASDTVTNRPLLITFHGGGSDETTAGPCSQYARMGYVCMSGDYRNDNSIPGFSSLEQKHAASDALALVRYARSHATQYGIDPSKIMLGGISAGGTTALEASIASNNLTNVNWFPVTDLAVNRDNDFGVVSSDVCLGTSNSGAPMVSTNSLIDANDPPTSLFLGEDDLSHGWTCDTGVVFTDALTAVGIPSYFQCFPDTGHSLNQGPAIDAVVIPQAYQTMIQGTCVVE